GKSDAYQRSLTHRWVRNMSESDWRRFIAHYHGLNAHIDTEVGRLFAYLDAQGLRDNTLIVFLSDHGEMMGAHRMAGKGPAMFEQSIGIPLIMRWPAEIPAGRQTDALFNTVDLPATLGALCGVPICAGAGIDQSEMVLGEGPGPRHIVFSEFYIEAGLRDDLMFVKTAVTDRWKLNLWLYDMPELYDLHNDPHETRNVIDDPATAGVRAELADEIVNWLRETDDPLLPTVEWTIGRVT
ncbi:MAG: sulfatase-like hydrolase/transferase, partial [bacterium]|nr:sulfatase-like hydrolase/transferase [bacterium]